jgi:hypothetical protein
MSPLMVNELGRRDCLRQKLNGVCFFDSELFDARQTTPRKFRCNKYASERLRRLQIR